MSGEPRFEDEHVPYRYRQTGDVFCRLDGEGWPCAAAARPAAGDTRTDRERLRDLIISRILDRWRALVGNETYLQASERFADAVMDEMAALLPPDSPDPTEPRPYAEQARELVLENRRLTETLRRVEALARDAERFPEGHVLNRVSANNLRYALSGPEPSESHGHPTMHEPTRQAVHEALRGPRGATEGDE